MDTKPKFANEESIFLNKKWNGMANSFSDNVESQTTHSNMANFAHLLRHVQGKDGRLKVLEIGSASGQFCKRLLEEHANLIQLYTLIDISDRMIELSMINLSAFTNISGITLEFKVCSIDNLIGISEAVYDVVVVNQCLHLVSHPDQALREIKRVLRPGGFIMASVLKDWRESSFFRILYELAQRHNVFDPSTNQSFKLVSDERLHNLLNEVGLLLLEMFSYSDYFEYSDLLFSKVFDVTKVLFNKETNEATLAEMRAEYQRELTEWCSQTPFLEKKNLVFIAQKMEQ